VGFERLGVPLPYVNIAAAICDFTPSQVSSIWSDGQPDMSEDEFKAMMTELDSRLENVERGLRMMANIVGEGRKWVRTAAPARV
jgi:hypothetical protein